MRALILPYVRWRMWSPETPCQHIAPHTYLLCTNTPPLHPQRHHPPVPNLTTGEGPSRGDGSPSSQAHRRKHITRAISRSANRVAMAQTASAEARWLKNSSAGHQSCVPLKISNITIKSSTWGAWLPRAQHLRCTRWKMSCVAAPHALALAAPTQVPPPQHTPPCFPAVPVWRDRATHTCR